MAGMNPVELRIIIDAQNRASAILKSAMKDVEKFQKGVQEVGPDTAHMTGKFGDLGLAASGAAKRMAGVSRAMLAMAGKAAGLIAIGAGLNRVAKSGALLEARIESLDGSFDEALTRIRKLSEESRGAFSMPELVDAESKISAFNIGMTMTPNMLKNIQGRAAQMGITTTKALDDIILGLARNSRKILDNVGLVVSQTEANKQYSRELGKAVHLLTDAERRTAFLNLAMKELEKTTMTMTSSYSSSIETTSMLKDAWAEIEMAFAPVMIIFRPLARIFMDIAKAAGSVLRPAVYALSLVLTAILHPISEVVAAFGVMFRAFIKLAEKAFGPLVGGLEDLLRIFAGLGIETKNADEQNKKLAKSSEELAEEAKNLADAWKEFGAEVRSTTTFINKTLLPGEVRLIDLEIQRLNVIKNTTGALSEQQKEALTVAKMDKVIVESKINLARVSEKYWKEAASVNRSFVDGAISAAEYYDQLGTLNENVQNESAAILELRDRKIDLLGVQHLEVESTKKVTRARKESKKALGDWWHGYKEVIAFMRDARKVTFNRIASIRSENAAIQDQTDDILAQRRIQKAAGPVERERLEHRQRMVKIQRDFNAAISELDPGNVSVGTQLLVEQVEVLERIERARFGEKLRDIYAAARADEIDRMNRSFRETASNLAAISPEAAVLQVQLGELTTTWMKFADSQTKGSKEIGGALANTAGSLLLARAAFIEDTKTRAKWMMAFELAMGTAKLFADPKASVAHFTAAAMFGAVASGIIKTGSSSASGGAGLAGVPGGHKVPQSPGDSGPRQIVINFTDGMVLGDPQSIAKKINESLDQASGTGAPAGV